VSRMSLAASSGRRSQESMAAPFCYLLEEGGRRNLLAKGEDPSNELGRFRHATA
jgi:hypothetical protein